MGSRMYVQVGKSEKVAAHRFAWAFDNPIGDFSVFSNVSLEDTKSFQPLYKVRHRSRYCPTHLIPKNPNFDIRLYHYTSRLISDCIAQVL